MYIQLYIWFGLFVYILNNVLMNRYFTSKYQPNT